MLFGFGGDVEAYDLSCSNPVSGFKNAVFVKILSDETVGNGASAEPIEGGQKQYISIKADRTELYFEDLLKAGLVLPADANNDSDYNLWEGCVANDWEEYGVFDEKLIDMRFVLSRTEENSCDLGAIRQDRVRYRIQQDGGAPDFFLYFMGYGTADGSIGPIPNKTCWDSDETTCKGQYKDQCFWYPIPNVHNCQARIDPAICGSLPENYCGEDKKIGSYACVWNKAENKCLTILKDSVQQNYGKPKDYAGPLPTCAFSGDCDNVNDILQVVVNFAWGGLLSIIGGAAFIMFVWAGFTIILSFGNPEKVKKGWHMLISAVIGMMIAFGAYLLIDFILTTLDVPASLRGIGR